MDITYRIRGGIPLKGDIAIGGSKNAALPLIAGSILAQGETVLTNVPRLRDTIAMVKILDFLGAETSFEGTTVRIRAERIRSQPIPAEYVSMLRGSIVLLGPLLARFGVVEMSYPGGCVLGKRPILAHVEAFRQMGAEDMSTDDVLHLQGDLQPGHVILPEFSVTATENVILAASVLPGDTCIHLAAAEPHVQDVEKFVVEMGAEVIGAGGHTVTVRGSRVLRGVTHDVISDYLEAGALVLAALVTRGKVRLHGIDRMHLLSFLDALRRSGCVWKYDEARQELFIDGELSSLASMNIRTNIFPGFPTDLQAPMGVAMTQAKGVSRMFERLYEGRMAYLYELEKMGAHVEVLNAHQALIIGPTPLKGRIVASNDIRAGAAMVLAALCADGETTITDVRYIERGYDRLDEKLRSLGAKIERMEIPS
ncbi:MAG: UDP-N-acetylglucosamine 1-carboxyvinyltransferase [Candidatus Peregrinibacteria bacterium Greene0416_19]|nr:MAG: UDP-N-acetylglucosamine 1-carboxyvinyltransferase [Candidatus Peregrinibacteria bacterium Greene0416_19]